MLILTRKKGQSIKIGNNVKVSILGINGKQVRIGTIAPREIEVHRSEIYEKIHGASDDTDGGGKRA